ncbi:zinc finger MYM-type protein 1-like [Microplitis demolitor]|uniref:zinc finger MYM-type protein 1-like n=1 Tax=Microplitis demolitor TaxID=69319 RepID=UPI0004CDBA62|nr:zinc finger MYM-type protein 1-like [Microplitis demolitor]
MISPEIMELVIGVNKIKIWISPNISGTKRDNSGETSRWLPESRFVRKLVNGEKVPRPWLIYSVSKRSVFCSACLLFDVDCSFNSKTGFNDWKHAGICVTEHEHSKSYKKYMLTLKQRSDNKNRIDQDLVIQTETKISYWRNVLRRVIAAIKALASQGLPFRGSDEKFGSPNNGNFLMLIEYLAFFDPFLKEHIRKLGNKGSGSTSYLSKTICEEVIQLLTGKISSIIVQEVKSAKYYAIIVDSTPNISHVDQLSFVLRYVKKYGTPIERFLMFIENSGHKGEDLLVAVLLALEFFSI